MKMKNRLMLLSVPALLLLAASATTVRSQTDDPGEPALTPQSQGLWRDLDGGYWCGGDCGPNQRCCSITVIEPPLYN